MKLWYRIKKTRMCTNTKRGFITVEAGIFLPIFIIGVLTLVYLIKLMAIQEAVFHSLTDEARKLSSEAFMYKYVPFFESRLVNRLYEENPIDISDVRLENFRYLKNYKGNSGMISMNLDYKVKLKLPIKFYQDFPISEALVFRGFIGKDEDVQPMPFEDMEKEEDSTLVWVFPISGGRYHQENCTYISAEPRETLLSDRIRRIYEPCHLCEPFNITNGNLVYCFTKSGESYHRGSCPLVEKYIISIDKEEAIKKCYKPCLRCCGGLNGK